MLDGFEEFPVDKSIRKIKVPIMHVELSLNVRYFIRGRDRLLRAVDQWVRGSGLTGKLAAAAQKIISGGRYLFFYHRSMAGKTNYCSCIIWKGPAFDAKLDISDLIIKTYYHDDFKKTVQDVYKEHLNALIGKKISNDNDQLKISLLELPRKGIEILKSYRWFLNNI